MNTYLGNEVTASGLRAQYDEHAKRLLSDKGVLAYILMYAVQEFQGYSLEEAKDAIIGEPEVASRNVRPAEAVIRQLNESKLPGEGTVTFDIVFFARVKNGEQKKIYINVEAQKSFYPGYDLVTRGVIYAARLLSEQMDTEYTPENYDQAKKVYSIFICMNTPTNNGQKETVADTITEYSVSPHVLYPNNQTSVAYGRYDLLSVVFVCLKDADTTASENKLIGMLSTLLSAKTPVNEKKMILEQKYHLPMSDHMESEANIMCNLGSALSMELQEELERKNENINELDAAIQEKDATLNELDAAIQEKDATLNELDAAIQEKDATINELDAAIQEKDAEILALKKQLASIQTQ